MKRKISDLSLTVLTWFFSAVTFAALLFLIGYILVKGIPNLSLSLFAWEYNSENVSLLPAMITTVIMVILSLLVAVPLGLFTAIYLVEYASRGNRLVKLVRVTAETLSGIPSIVYGLFGMLFFCYSIGVGLLASRGHPYLVGHDSAAHHADGRRKPEICAGRISGRLFWAGGRAFAHRL